MNPRRAVIIIATEAERDKIGDLYNCLGFEAMRARSLYDFGNAIHSVYYSRIVISGEIGHESDSGKKGGLDAVDMVLGAYGDRVRRFGNEARKTKFIVYSRNPGLTEKMIARFASTGLGLQVSSTTFAALIEQLEHACDKSKEKRHETGLAGLSRMFY